MSVALVTGSAKRIGRTLALALAGAGHAVIVHHNRSAEAAEAVAGEIRAAGGRAATARADLTDAAETEALIARAALPFGPPDVLINNASLFVEDAVDRFEVEQWNRQLAANLRAPAILVRDLARTLPADAQGAVVNIIDCKIADLAPDFFSYSVGKASLAAVTEMQARALAPRIRVNGIAPGLVLRSGKQTEERFRAIHDNNILRRGTRPEDIAEAVLYLLRAEAITGQVLYVDGGDRFTVGRYDPEPGG